MVMRKMLVRRSVLNQSRLDRDIFREYCNCGSTYNHAQAADGYSLGTAPSL